MSVIPLLSDGHEDDTFAPPDIEAGTRDYGSVRVRNRADRPTIVPTGAAWISRQRAQDHAAKSGALVRASSTRDIPGYCVQETQGGLLRGVTDFVVLPAPLRSFALVHRNRSDYSAMWSHIRGFKKSFALTGAGNLVEFLESFQKELDLFVAEFELVPGQIGAIILIGGQVIGIERAPSVAFWDSLWVPLVRVCYGSLALRVARSGASIPSTRKPLIVGQSSLDGIRAAIKLADEAMLGLTTTLVGNVHNKQLGLSAGADDELAGMRLLTLASQEYAGQIVRRGQEAPVYASICAASV
jgi:hypothetical protein